MTPLVLDTNMSLLEGSVGMLPRRLVVPEASDLTVTSRSSGMMEGSMSLVNSTSSGLS